MDLRQLLIIMLARMRVILNAFIAGMMAVEKASAIGCDLSRVKTALNET